MDEEAWQWPNNVRKKLHPRRGGVEAQFRKVMAPRKAFKALADAYALHRAERSFDAQSGAAFDKLSAPLDKSAPAPLEPAYEATMVRHFYTMAFGAEMVDYWMGTEGASFAVEALVATHRLSNHNERGWFEQTHCVETAWVRLRQRLAGTGKGEYTAALALARSLWPDASFQDRLRIAYAFPAEPQWADDVVDAYLKRPERTRVESLYHSVLDASRMGALLERGPIWWEPGIFFSFVEGAGVHASDALIPLLEGKRTPPQRKRVYEALALIPSDAAIQSLIERVDDRAVSPFLMSAAIRWPTRADRLVTKALSVKKAGKLSALLDAVHIALRRA